MARGHDGLRGGSDPPRVQVSRSPIQAIDRAVAILLALSEAGPTGLLLGTLAADVGLHTSTAHTLLNALVTHGLASQDAPSRHYRLGARFLELHRSYMTRADLATVAAPAIQTLWEDTAETVHLCVLQNFQRVDLTVLASPQILAVCPANVRRDQRPSLTLHRTAAGKILLTILSDTELSSYIARCDISAMTPATVTGRKRIRAELENVRQLGHATNRGEEAVGVNGVAAPIQNAAGHTVAALCIGYPSARFTEDYEVGLRDAAIDAARQISRLLGAEDLSAQAVR